MLSTKANPVVNTKAHAHVHNTQAFQSIVENFMLHVTGVTADGESDEVKSG